MQNRALAGFDLETTSPQPETARIVQAALVLVEPDGSAGDLFNSLICQDEEIPVEATAIHGIYKVQCDLYGVPLSEAINSILLSLENLAANRIPLVVFNPSFDLSILLRECGRCDLVPYKKIPNDVIDPLLIDRTFNKWRKGSRKLGDTMKVYGVQTEGDLHGARADAIGTVHLARALWKKYGVLNSYSMAELQRLQYVWYEDWKQDVNKYWERLDKRKEDGTPMRATETWGWPWI